MRVRIITAFNNFALRQIDKMHARIEKMEQSRRTVPAGRSDQFRFGTPRKGSNQRAMVRFALRNHMGEDVLIRTIQGNMTRRELYGKHPTKRR